jgi:hypothetical protein
MVNTKKFIDEAKKQGIDPEDIAPSAGGTLRDGVSQIEELENKSETKKEATTSASSDTASKKKKGK